MKYLKRLFGRRKCELLREAERDLFWFNCRAYFAKLAWARVCRRNRKTAKELERRGML
jgi:membrane protein required for beta-lactamase induction